jgi:hypothetical protein
LLAPIETESPRYSGDPWPRWDPERVQVVFVDDETDVLVLTDPQTGDRFDRPAGTDGDSNTDALDGDLSGPWQGTLTTVSSVNVFDATAGKVEDSEVVLTCDDDGTCMAASGSTILEPLGGGLDRHWDAERGRNSRGLCGEFRAGPGGGPGPLAGFGDTFLHRSRCRPPPTSTTEPYAVPAGSRPARGAPPPIGRGGGQVTV